MRGLDWLNSTGRRRGVGASVLLMVFALAALAWAGRVRADSLALSSGAGQSGLGGSVALRPLVVTVRNVDGAPIAGRSIQWTTVNNFQLAANSSLTDANGMASVGFTYGDYGLGSITASDAVAGNVASAPETSIGSDSFTLISGGSQFGQAGNASTQPIVVELRNAGGAPISGRTVNWSNLD
ncbi:MAG: Ig-like domain-containing protein, partial [Arenimonas sp.]